MKLPSILGKLGPMRVEHFVGQLRGHQFIYGTQTGLVGGYDSSVNPQPFIYGSKIGFKPTPNLEFNFSTTSLFAGAGVPFTTHSFLNTVLGLGNGLPGSVDDPGDRRSALDFSYRLPKLRNWLTFYANGFADDQFSPIAYADRSAWTAGLYAPKLPHIRNLDLRAEGLYTDLPIGGGVSHGFFYLNRRYPNGYTNSGNLIGSWIGRQSQGARAISTYHLGPRAKIQFDYRHQKISNQFVREGGTITDGSVGTDFHVRDGVLIRAHLQYEWWNIPAIARGQQSNWTSSVQVTIEPKYLRWVKQREAPLAN
jgi:hypothetical protein